jgi:hypothetical protein
MSCSSRGDINAEVRNNPAEYRYEVWVDDELAGYTQYVLRPGRIAFLHTEVYHLIRAWAAGWPGPPSTTRAPGG